MIVVRLSMSVIQSLIRAFDRSRLVYMFVWFPIYQLFAIIGVVAIAFAFVSMEETYLYAPLGFLLALFVGIPIIVSWHLSCLLFLAAYFGFFASLGVPFMAWTEGQLTSAVGFFRPRQ